MILCTAPCRMQALPRSKHSVVRLLVRLKLGISCALDHLHPSAKGVGRVFF